MLIEDKNDIENYYILKDEYQKKIQFIRDEYKKRNYCSCSKIMNEIETKYLEVFDYKEIRSISKNSISDFLLFGDVYSDIGDVDKAIFYCQRYHYSIYNIKSPYRDKHIKALSFRTISPYSLSDLINNELTVCSPLVMNDPFDSIALLWASPDNAKKIGRGFRQNHKPYIESYKPFKIRCFTKNRIRNKKNILMWSHYADNHSGLCIEYTFPPDFIEQRNYDQRTFSLFLDVDYTYDNDNILKEVWLNTTQAFASKAKCWRYENELRLLYYNPNFTNNYGKIPLERVIFQQYILVTNAAMIISD